jgi:hypothetical protein
MVFQPGPRRDTPLKKLIDLLISNPFVELIARICLGCVFVYASIHKIIDPGAFAKIIYGYGLFPAIMINATAIVLPYIEFFAGLLLILGIFPRSSAVLIEGLLLAFIIAISINLIRGHEFDCGCFSFHKENQDAAGLELLIRDVLWFGVGMIVVGFRAKRKFSLIE